MWGSGYGFRLLTWCAGLRALFRVLRIRRVQGLGFRVWGLGFRVGY